MSVAVPAVHATIDPDVAASAGSLRRARLVKRYGRRTVVDGVDLRLDPGEIVALLGPNGAGKTTSFYMMVGFVRPNAGRIELAGVDVTSGRCTGAPVTDWATSRRSRARSGA
jgi:lipopolysaccharide export system ATP-binding protein